MTYSGEVSERLKSIARLLAEIDELGMNVQHHRIDELKPLQRRLEKIEVALSNSAIGNASKLTKELLDQINSSVELLRSVPRSDAARVLGSLKSDVKSSKARHNGRYYGGRKRTDGQPQKRKHHLAKRPSDE